MTGDRTQMGKLRTVAVAMMAAGLAGLIVSFRSLIRERGDAAFFAVAGLVLLAVGALLYLFSPDRSAGKCADETPPDTGQ